MGTFVMLHWHPCSERSWRDLFVSKRYDLRGRPRSQPVRCDQCTFHTFDPKLRFNYCWMDKMTSKSTLYFSSFINNKKKLKSWTFHQTSGGTKDKQETKLNRRVVVMMAARSVFLLIPSLFVFFLHVFPCQLDRKTGTDDTSLPLLSLSVVSAE